MYLHVQRGLTIKEIVSRLCIGKSGYNARIF
jgi:hypothetical protein